MGIRKHAAVAARAALPVLIVAAFAACSSDSITGTTNGIDANAVANAATTVNSIVNQPAMVSLLAGLDGSSSVSGLDRIPAAVGAFARIPAVPQLSLGSRSPFAARATRVGAAFRALKPVDARRYAYVGPLINDTLKGRSYVRVVDPNTGYSNWQWDPNRTGAPANGVRFVLFQFDTVTGAWNNNEAGYLDVIDSSANPTSRLIANLLTPGANGRTVMHTRYASGGTETTSTDTLTGTISNDQGKSITYSMNANLTFAGEAPRDVESISAQLSDNSMSMSAALVDGTLTANDKQQLTGTIGNTTIALTANAVRESGASDYVISDTTHISVNGNAIGYATPSADEESATPLNFYNNDGSPMSSTEVDALKQFLGATDQLVGAVLVGYTLTFWLFLLSAGF